MTQPTSDFYYAHSLSSDKQTRWELPAIWPHPVPHADRAKVLKGTPGVYSCGFSDYTLAPIILAQGETFPAAFPHHIRRDQTTGSDPRRTWSKLADWKAVDHRTPAKRDADVMLGYAEHLRLKTLSDEFHHQTPGAKRPGYLLVRAELEHEMVVRAQVHALIDGVPEGQPITEAGLKAHVAAARALAPVVIGAVTRGGAGGGTTASVTGTATAGASVRLRALNITPGNERRELPWTPWQLVAAGTRAFAFSAVAVGGIGSAAGDKIAIEVEQHPGGAIVRTSDSQHVVI